MKTTSLSRNRRAGAAFSESSQFREILLIAKRAKPKVTSKCARLKNLETHYMSSIWKKEPVDEIHEVQPKEAEEAARLLAPQEGIFVGPSSGAIFHIAFRKASIINNGVIVSISPDGGKKYLSTALCDPVLCLK